MSTSVVRKKWGMGPSDVAKRLAIVLRIWVRGTSSYAAPLRTTTGAGDATDAGIGVGALSRSRLTTRPPGPDPWRRAMSTPVSFAIRFANGDALTRAASVGAGTGAGVGAAAGAGA